MLSSDKSASKTRDFWNGSKSESQLSIKSETTVCQSETAQTIDSSMGEIPGEIEINEHG